MDNDRAIEPLALNSDSQHADRSDTPRPHDVLSTEERLHIALEAAEAALWDYDASTDCVVWSSGSYALFGFDDTRPVTIDCWQRNIHPDDLPRVQRALADAIANLTLDYVTEYRIRHPKRGLRWICSRGRPHRDASGRVTRLSGLSIDVTDRVRSEEDARALPGLQAANEALRRSEARLRVALEASRIGIFEYDLDSGHLQWDARLRDIRGVGPDEPVDFEQFIARIVPEDRGAVTHAIAAAVEPGGSGEYRAEFRERMAPGAALRWMRGTGRLFSGMGLPRRIVGTVQDITEQREREALLVAEQERYQRIFDVAGVSLWEMDWTGVRALFDTWRSAGINDPAEHCLADPANLQRALGAMRVTRVNQETLRLYDAPSAAALLGALPRLWLPEPRPQWGAILHAFATGQTRIDVERPAITLSGRRMEQLVSFSFGENASRVDCVLASVFDVTPLKRAAAFLRESNRRKDEFLAMLAHELRNPLAPIRNAAELLRSAETDAPRVAFARELIDRQLAQLARLIDDLLDVSRIVQGKVRIDRDLLDLREVVRQAVENTRAAMTARGHDFALLMPSEPVTVFGDTVRLTQVVSNLLDNATKYTAPGGHISLALECNGNAATLRVQDSGEGIPLEIQGEIFELFAQGSRSLDRPQGGLGIGLTIVRRLVEMHGGRVTASSAGAGSGSEFTVVLPLAHESIGARPAPATRENATVAGQRVLVVDDNQDAAESLAMLLGMSGCAVEVAPDGPAALEAAKRIQPQVVILDIGLPGMDGFEVARALRGDATLRNALIIASTGYGHDEDRRRALAAGCDEHLVKPIDFGQLLTLMAGRRAITSPAASLASTSTTT